MKKSHIIFAFVVAAAVLFFARAGKGPIQRKLTQKEVQTLISCYIDSSCSLPKREITREERLFFDACLDINEYCNPKKPPTDKEIDALIARANDANCEKDYNCIYPKRDSTPE